MIFIETYDTVSKVSEDMVTPKKIKLDLKKPKIISDVLLNSKGISNCNI